LGEGGEPGLKVTLRRSSAMARVIGLTQASGVPCYCVAMRTGVNVDRYLGVALDLRHVEPPTSCFSFPLELEGP
jgi:hypothetical protein